VTLRIENALLRVPVFESAPARSLPDLSSLEDLRELQRSIPLLIEEILDGSLDLATVNHVHGPPPGVPLFIDPIGNAWSRSDVERKYVWRCLAHYPSRKTY